MIELYSGDCLEVMDKIINKGLQIRNNKNDKHNKKMRILKDDQEDLCRFVTVGSQQFKRVKGKWKHKGGKKMSGLQIENKVYLQNGKYKFINNSNVKVLKEFKDIPHWATEELIERYKNYLLDN